MYKMMKSPSKSLRNFTLNKILFVLAIINNFQDLIKCILAKCLEFRAIMGSPYLFELDRKSLELQKHLKYFSFSKEPAITSLHARWCTEDQKSYQMDEYIWFSKDKRKGEENFKLERR